MSGLPEGEPAGIALKSDEPRQSNSSGGVKYLPESPGYLYPVRSAAPTSGQRQVLSKVSSINSKVEAGDGDAPQQPPPGGSLTVRSDSVTTGSAVGGPLQQFAFIFPGTCTSGYMMYNMCLVPEVFVLGAYTL
jgi:hypothetical protein